jgi:hypothetical protein
MASIWQKNYINMKRIWYEYDKSIKKYDKDMTRILHIYYRNMTEIWQNYDINMT